MMRLGNIVDDLPRPGPRRKAARLKAALGEEKIRQQKNSSTRKIRIEYRPFANVRSPATRPLPRTDFPVHGEPVSAFQRA